MRYLIYSEPNSGKSVFASQLYAKLKIGGRQAELVRERVKNFAYLQRKPVLSEEIGFFYDNLEEEVFFSELGVDVVADSPLYLSCFYHWKYNLPFLEELLALARKVDRLYPTTHIWFKRGDWSYQKQGRFQTEEEAKAISDEMFAFLCSQKIELVSHNKVLEML